MLSKDHQPDPKVERAVPEEALYEGDEQYRLLVRSAREYAMLILDLEGRVTAWNRGAERLFGYSEEEVLGRSGALIFTEEDRAKQAPERELAQAAERGWARDERWHVRKDASRFWGMGAMEALLAADGTVQGYAKILRDTTRRKAAEDALRRNERLFDAILSQMPSGLAIADAPSGRLLLHNEEAIRLLRHPLIASDDYTGYAQYGALHPDGTPYAPEEYPIARALHGETVHQEEMMYRRGDGTRTTFSVNAAPIRNDGLIVRAVSTFHDISELKAVQEQLRQLNQTLERRVEERTRQVRTMASRLTMAEQAERRRIAQLLHDDLQQLLYGIEMKLAFLHDGIDADDPDRLDRELEDTRSWIEQAIRTTRQLSVDLSPPILTSGSLADALSWLQRQMHELHALDVTVTIEPHPTIANDDLRILLFQIVRELLFNVKKHAGVDEAFVRLTEDGGHAVVHVVDNGCGFSTDAAATTDDQHGFGLFSVRERLKLMGGHLEIRSAPGEGTHVTVHAPAPHDSDQL